MGPGEGGARGAAGGALLLVAVGLLAAVPGSTGLALDGDRIRRTDERRDGRGEAAYAAPSEVHRLNISSTPELEDRTAWRSERSSPRQFPVEYFFNVSRPPSFSGQLPRFVNSASEHGEQPTLSDRALVSGCLALPLLLCGIARVWEGAGSRACPPEPCRGRRPRIGSLYRLQEQERGSMTPVGTLMQTFDADTAEGTVLQNTLAGLTVALAMIPNVVSFSFVTETPPANGLWACAFMSISASLVGGRPGVVSGVSAGTAAVLSGVSTPDDMGGMAPMALCVFCAGLLQLLFGLLRVSKLVTLIPHPVMLGFVNGLALVMLRSQLRHFHEHGDGPWVSYGTFVSMMVIGGVAMFVAMAWRRVPNLGTTVPSALASLVITTAFSFVVPTRTVGDVAGPGMLEVGLGQVPKWDFPPVGMEWSNHNLVLKALSLSFRLALVGLLESLLTEALIDQITGTAGSMRRECFGQGVGNIVASLFGTQGGCALLGHSLLNVSSGGRSRLSGVIAGFALILCATVSSPLVAMVPVAGVMGILILIALNTFAWGIFRLIWRINWMDLVVVIVVMLITVWYDVAVAVFVGVVVHALGFAWTIATEARVEVEVGPDTRTFFPHRPALLRFGDELPEGDGAANDHREHRGLGLLKVQDSGHCWGRRGQQDEEPFREPE